MDQEQSLSPPTHNDRPSSSDAEPEKNLSSDALILLRHAKTFQRVSADIQESWDAVQQGKQGTAPAQTFLAHSFGAWLAYVGVHRAAKQASNFSGKADCKRLADELDSLPQDRLRQLAAEVVGAFPESQKQMVENFRQLLQSAHPRTPTSQPSKRQRRARSSQSPASGTSHPSFTVPDQATIPSVPYDPLLANNESVMINPPLVASRNLFPDDLSNAIATNEHPADKNILVGAISMAFPDQGSRSYVCQMSLEITHDKVQYFAKKWFGARLEARDGLRYSISPDGSKIVPSPEFTLQGMQRAILSREFGREVSHAIKMSPRCLDDERHVRTCTDSVSMVVSAKEHVGAHVLLLLGLIEGTRLKHRLFASS